MTDSNLHDIWSYRLGQVEETVNGHDKSIDLINSALDTMPQRYVPREEFATEKSHKLVILGLIFTGLSSLATFISVLVLIAHH